jgi:hypothetical protein
MGTDAEDVDPDARLADLSDPEFRAYLKKFDKLVETARLEGRMPPAEDVPRDVFQLDLEHPPTTTQEPLQQIAYTLLSQLPQRWESVMLDVHAAADEVRYVGLVITQEADEPLDKRFRFFSGLTEPCLALRRATYDPHGQGVWYSAIIRLSPDGTGDAIYNFTFPPFGCWGPHEQALVLRDQEMYPRDLEQLPDWHPAAQADTDSGADETLSTDAQYPNGSFSVLLADVPDPEIRAEFSKLLTFLEREPEEDEEEPADAYQQLDVANLASTPQDPLQHIGYTLLSQLQEPWGRVFLDLTVAAEDVRHSAMVTKQSSGLLTDSRTQFFSHLAEPCLALRRETYEPDGRGVWYSAHIRLFNDGRIDVTYDFVSPPFHVWGPREPALLLRDQEMYPRDRDRLPLWHPAR